MDEAPSPKVQRKEAPPAQLESVAEAVKATARGATPVAGVAEVVQDMAQGSLAKMVPVLMHDLPSTVAVMVQV